MQKTIFLVGARVPVGSKMFSFPRRPDRLWGPPNNRWWWWVWNSRRNKNWQGRPKYYGKICPSVTLSTITPTWLDLRSNPGRRSEDPETNRLSYGTTIFRKLHTILIYTPRSSSSQIEQTRNTKISVGKPREMRHSGMRNLWFESRSNIILTCPSLNR
jgi:hypothetical protein